MSPPYRLGDMIRFYGSEEYGINSKYVSHFPDSIAGKYWANAAYKTNDYEKNMDTLASIVNDHCAHIPKLKNVIHVRLGDVMCNTGDPFINRQPDSPDKICNVINTNMDSQENKTILHGNHMNQCITESNAFLENIVQCIPNSSVQNGNPADEDFCKMVNADIFVAGKGGFSQMATAVRSYNKKSTILDLSKFNVWRSVASKLERRRYWAHLTFFYIWFLVDQEQKEKKLIDAIAYMAGTFKKRLHFAEQDRDYIKRLKTELSISEVERNELIQENLALRELIHEKTD